MPDSRFLFSNFQESVVYLDGQTCPTVEHAFQAAKTLDPDERKRVIEAKTPASARGLGRKVTLRRDWEKAKNGIMLDLLRQKFAPGTERARELMACEEPIIEYNTWHDTYWGVCTCARHNGKGSNNLGFLLKIVRQELINRSQIEAIMKANGR